MEFNLGTLVTAIIASFLSGAALATISMLFSFSNKLGKFEAKLDIITKQLEDHIRLPTIVCSYHAKMTDDLQDVKTQTALNTQEIANNQA
jgi:hypothetical protein